MLQENIIKDLLAKKEQINTKIILIKRDNEHKRAEKDKIYAELKTMGVIVNDDNLEETLQNFTDMLEADVEELKKEIEDAEKILGE